MDIKLLKELNESTVKLDEFESALREAEMEFDIDLGDDMGDDDPDNVDYEKIAMNLDTEELQRIADHWEGEGSDMDDDDLADEIGNELEMLEYSPEEISAGISKVMSMLGRDDYLGEPEDGELEDIESEGDDDFGEDERF